MHDEEEGTPCNIKMLIDTLYMGFGYMHDADGGTHDDKIHPYMPYMHDYERKNTHIGMREKYIHTCIVM